MENFDVRIAEIDRGLYNRLVIGVSGIVLTPLVTVILAATGLQV